MLIKEYIKSKLNTIGIDIHRPNQNSSPLAVLMKSLSAHNIDLVFDIGANEGQFVRELRVGGYKGNVVSFEPMGAAYQRLLRNSRRDSLWSVHSRCALGNHEGQIKLNIAGNSASSSILPMLPLHSKAAPESAYVDSEQVSMTTFDGVAGAYLQSAKAPFLKIDTQGYESLVLDGAEKTLPEMQGVLVELSTVPLYEGQQLWHDIVIRLENEGFLLWSLFPVFLEPSNARTLQWDGLFFRN